MKKFFRIAALVAVAMVFIYTLVFLYQKSLPKPDVYEIVKSEFRDLQRSTVATGKIEPRNEILVKPQISGIISELYKEAGQPVKAGEVIAKVKVIAELGQLNQAESRLRLAQLSLQQTEAEHGRTASLFEKRFVTQEEFEQSKLALTKAKEEVLTAQNSLDIIRDGITKESASISSTLIRSTITGLILDIPVKVGNSVIQANTMNDGTTIATVANMNDIIFRGKVDETEVGRINEGMPVKISLGALQDMSFDARLEYISPKGVEENGANQFEIKAALNVPDSVIIRSGYSANAEIVLQSVKHVISVPEQVLEFKGDSTFVYQLIDTVPNQQFERIRVAVGMSDGLNIEIKSGIDSGVELRGTKIDGE